VSHKLDLTAAQFNYLAPILEAKFGAEVSWSYGRQKLTMPNGSVWHIRAATPAAGHGYSCDLITADEVWQISEAAIDDGLLPSQRARRNPLCLMVSTAGTQESKALLRWRDQGLKAIDTSHQTNLYFAEYSPPPSLDPMTVEAWEYANPALEGGLIELDVIQGEAQGPNRSAFLRASVNLWQAVSNSWLAPGLFEALATDEPAPPGGVLAIETAQDESTYTAVRAVNTGSKTHVVLAFVAETITELWEKVDAEIASNPNLRLAIVPTLENTRPLKYEKRTVIVGYKELVKWTTAVRALILENKITHNNQQLLNSHVERAVLIREKNGISISSLRSPGPIEACRCMIWAAALASRPQAIGKPVIVSGIR
jgi:phage terminase large subunit-like protein